MSDTLHSVRFDELAVALPAHISHPLLRQLAARLQAPLLSPSFDDAANQDGVKGSSKNDSISSGQAYESGVMAQSGHAQIDDHHANHDIQQSAQILMALNQTPIADASVLVAITNEQVPRLLLTRRAGHLNTHAGEVSFAGGKHEPADGSNIVTALREACEETALAPNQVQLLGQLPVQTSKSGMSVRPIVVLVPAAMVLVPELGEIARIFWADFETLIDQPLEEYAIDYPVDKQTMTLLTPSWRVDGETVWGLTGRIIASLLAVGFDRHIDWYYRAQA
ncbi:NUDIX hydrolase [Psychrobacter pygoscelis]|uniref:NUDIX hydrolase n=1 Tax=Psychrobacter pygoscelis TaxID=2488563 RepID=UPI001F62436A|nr:CoA pyrophosphatase [Psychrobacter pygoscelis]